MRKTLRQEVNSTLLIILFGLLLILSSCQSDRQATVAVNQETITTYPFSDPDPIPVFARSSLWGSGSRIYPYFVFNGFSTESRPQDWTVVRLKNKYLEVAVLPEVGGKVWGAKDLTTGRNFLYTNRVLKFREISLRGPWTSGGIEFNFGIIGHAPSTATPVDYFVEKKPDGRLVCTVGNYDWPSRTRWQVTITVYPDRAYFETRARWTNPGPYRQSYYAWMCPAVPASPDLKYIFPGKYHIGHDYSVPLEPWPVDSEGRDLSWYRHNNFGGAKSYFVVGHYEHFYGGYYQNSDSGFGHQALYSDMPGKKIWIWDLSRAGEIWVDLLTDADGQYTEPQSGRLLNQSDHGTFFPATSDSWKELWFPYSGIGPMAGAAAGVVLSLNPKGNSLELGIYALENIKEKLVIKQGAKEIRSQPLVLKPAEKAVLNLDGISQADDLTICLGQKIIHQPLQARELVRPFNFHRPAGDSAESLFLAAQTLENERDYGPALEKYRQVVDMVPDHLRALTRLAELHLRRGEYQQALDFARGGLEISMYDPEANYVYGNISRRLNKPAEAKEALGWAARSPALALPSYLQLAEIALAEGDYSQAEEYARRALNFDRENPLPYELLAVALRLQQRKKEASRTCRQLLELEPLNHLARYELYLLHQGRSRLADFRKSIRNEFPAETYLELALFYLRTGQLERSVELLSLAPGNPEVLVWLAYLQQSLDPDESQAALEKSAAASPWLVFPFREESIPVLEWAAARKPGCWKFRYYLGLLFWHKGRLEEARQLFAQLDEADYYPVFISRAYLNHDNREAAYRDLQRAWKLAPEAWRTWHHLIKHELEQGLKDQALRHSLEALEKFPDNMYLQSDTVKALLASARYREAASLLDSIRVLPYEGASEVHGLFVQTHLHLALDLMLEKNWTDALDEISRSRDYPEQLGTGRPYDPDQRIQDYLEALCYQALGQKEKSRKKYLDIIDYSRKFPTGPYACFTDLAWQKLGRSSKPKGQPALASLPMEFRSRIIKLVLSEER
ncbi:MAG: DUF5107 domain-containing protein [Candidatus Aminicenantes bacterium]|nr:DUF5107 domain-containing protein [Candidatus Aminicenantes bacterium]